MSTNRDAEPEESFDGHVASADHVKVARDLMLVVGAETVGDMSTSEVCCLAIHRGMRIVFHLQDCTENTIKLLTAAAEHESRTGWVSEALVRLLVRECSIREHGFCAPGLLALLRDESISLPSNLTWHFERKAVAEIAKSLESEHAFMAAVGAEQIQQGHAIAAALALREGGILKESVKLGYDVRSAVLQGLTIKACLLTDLPSPIVVSDAACSPHTSADAFALETQMQVGKTAKRMALLFGGEVRVLPPLIVRLNPRSNPSTAIVVKVQLPGMHPVCFAWPAERSR